MDSHAPATFLYAWNITLPAMPAAGSIQYVTTSSLHAAFHSAFTQVDVPIHRPRMFVGRGGRALGAEACEGRRERYGQQYDGSARDARTEQPSMRHHPSRERIRSTSASDAPTSIGGLARAALDT